MCRLVRVCMGPTAIAERKLDFGKQLIVLGVGIDIKPSGFSCWPSDDKVTKWTRRIDLALTSGKLSPGEASKLSGALMWATQAIFKRLGRAMLRPIIRQIHNVKSSIGSELAIALKWWREVLNMGLREERPWHQVPQKTIHMYTDARSTPPRVAAVLIRFPVFVCGAFVVVIMLLCSEGWIDTLRGYGAFT